MSNKAKPPKGRILVSAVLVHEVKGDPTASMDLLGVIHPARPLNEEGRMIVRGTLYSTIYFHEPRPGAHTLQIVLCVGNSQRAVEIDCTPIEQGKEGNIDVRLTPIKFNLAPILHTLYVEVDGIQRAALPFYPLTSAGQAQVMVSPKEE